MLYGIFLGISLLLNFLCMIYQQLPLSMFWDVLLLPGYIIGIDVTLPDEKRPLLRFYIFVKNTLSSQISYVSSGQFDSHAYF